MQMGGDSFLVLSCVWKRAICPFSRPWDNKLLILRFLLALYIFTPWTRSFAGLSLHLWLTILFGLWIVFSIFQSLLYGHHWSGLIIGRHFATHNSLLLFVNLFNILFFFLYIYILHW